MLALALMPGCYSGLGTGPDGAPAAEDEADGADGDGSGGGDDDDDADDGGTDVPEPACGHDSVAPARIWRLSDSQHANAIRDLLGLQAVTEVKTPGTAEDSFVNESELLTVTGPMASQYEAAASDAAASALESIGSLVPCDPASGDEACAREFIDAFVPRAYRRPIDDEEREAFVSLYHHGAEEDFATGIGTVIEATLQAPSFLYRTEIGADDAVGPTVMLDAYELASAIGFLLLDSVPDDELWARAEDGTITDPEVLEAEVERLLATPRVQDNLVRIFAVWLGTPKAAGMSKAAEMFPEFELALAEDMAREAEEFLRHLLPTATVADLLTSRTTFVNERLASVYGIDAVTGEGFVQVELPAQERSGILTQPAMMSILAAPEETSVVHRGLLVQKLLLCTELPAPPAGVDLDDPDFEGMSQRELAELRASEEACRACHSVIDPLGLTFEHYDAIGRYRTDIDGAPVDASAEVAGIGAVNDAVELMNVLVDDPRVSACVSRNLVTYALGRRLGATDACELENIQAQVDAADGSLIEPIRAVALSEALRLRKREEQ